MKEFKAWAVVDAQGNLGTMDDDELFYVCRKEVEAISGCVESRGERVVRVTVRIEE